METQQLEILIGGYHVSKRLNKSDEMKQLEKRIRKVAQGLDLFQRRVILDRLKEGDTASPEEVRKLQ